MYLIKINADEYMHILTLFPCKTRENLIECKFNVDFPSKISSLIIRILHAYPLKKFFNLIE